MYKVEFDIITPQSHRYADTYGFLLKGTEDFFDPGFGVPLVYHDVFEHWFENSKFFKTETLSIAGECVAMGIRKWHHNYSGLVQKFGVFNSYLGEEENTRRVIEDLLLECLPNEDEEIISKFSTDFNFKHLRQWKKANDFKGLFYSNFDPVADFADDVETALSYGYWLAEKMYDADMYAAENFLTLYKAIYSLMGYNKDSEPYHYHPFPFEGSSAEIIVKKKLIEFKMEGKLIFNSQNSLEQVKHKMEKHSLYYYD